MKLRGCAKIRGAKIKGAEKFKEIFKFHVSDTKRFLRVMDVMYKAFLNFWPFYIF